MHLDNTHPPIPESKAFRFFASQCLNVVLLSISRYSTHQSKATFLVLGGTSQIGVDTSSLLFPCSLPFVTERFQHDAVHWHLQHHMQVFRTLRHIHRHKPQVRLHIVNIHQDPSFKEDIEDSTHGILHGYPGQENGPFGSK